MVAGQCENSDLGITAKNWTLGQPHRFVFFSREEEKDSLEDGHGFTPENSCFPVISQGVSFPMVFAFLMRALVC